MTEPVPHVIPGHPRRESRRQFCLHVAAGRALGWNGVALKTCKTQTGALLALARAHGMVIMVQDLTNPMLAAVETNAMQFYPAASVAEARVHPGIYRRRAGRVRLDRPVRRQLAPPARGRRGLRHRPFGNLSVPQALPASNGWHAACCAIRAGLPTTGGAGHSRTAFRPIAKGFFTRSMSKTFGPAFTSNCSAPSSA